MSEGIHISRDLLTKKRTDIIDSISMVALIVGFVACIINGSFIWGVIFLCMLIGFYNNMENGQLKIKVNTRLEERGLYEISSEKEVYHVLASSMDEVNLYCFTEKIEGDIKYIGKVKYFV